MADWNPVMLWRETPPTAKFGPGVSRPRDGERTRPYLVIVRTAEASAMKVTLLAPSKRAAIRYARNRWPGAEIENCEAA